MRKFLKFGGLGLLAFIVFIACVGIFAQHHDDDNPGSGPDAISSSPTYIEGSTSAPTPGSVNSGAHAAAQDVMEVDCGAIEPDSGLVDGNVTIQNHTSKRSSYLLTLGIYVNGSRVSEGSGVINSVAPGDMVSESWIGELPATATIKNTTCKLESADRLAG